MPNPETNLTRRIMERLRAEFPGIWVLKVHGGPHQRRGVPDLLVCMDGLLYAVEVKVPGKEPTPQQYAEMERLAEAGAQVTWADNVADVVRFLRGE